MIDLNPLTDQDRMPYGKYAGEKMINIPDNYFIFLYLNNKCSPAVKKYIEDSFDEHKLRK